MFTGLVEGACPIVEQQRGDGSLRLTLDLGSLADGVAMGDSIAVAGCCLTVDGLEGARASFHLMDETLGLTTFGARAKGGKLNVERSLRVGDRMGGHFLSGHVDGLGTVTELVELPGQLDMTIRMPERLSELTIPKGSIGIDGVSLTIARLQDDHVTVCLIPHTLEVTTLGDLEVGDHVHLEMDMIGKWVRRLVRPE